ncbi:SDR family NAD(P)-dependent oxidoreductase [Aeromonas enterica]
MKTVLITGGINGLGKSIADQFVLNGYRVFVTSRSLLTLSSKVTLIPLDLSTPLSVCEFINRAEDLIDGLDVFISNAGILIPETINDMKPESLEKMIAVNLSSPLLLTQWVCRKMNDDGHILFVSSIASIVSKPTSVAYSAVKSAIIGIVKSLALDLASKSILVNSISPGPINSDMVDRLVSENERVNIVNSIPLKRLAKPDEVARVVFFLCSEDNTYLTGQNIIIDGGFTCR